MSVYNLISRTCVHNYLKKILKFPTRSLNLLEFQSKNLLDTSKVAIQRFCIVDESGYNDLSNFKADEYVIKAQILAGGRGKGHFSNGFKGGVHITKNHDEVSKIARQMLGHNLITKQTPPDGIKVQSVMVAESVNIVRETYVCILMDRQHNGPVIIASPAGGVDIETVATNEPHLIRQDTIDMFEGLTMEMAVDISKFLEFKGELVNKAAVQLINIWELFCKVDATQLEINPFVETDNNQVIAVDAKLAFDDNAQFRQKEIFALENAAECDPRELEASKHNLNYISMDGSIGCMVNGAGLAMATMDIIKLYGGEPANFLDVGGAVQEDQVLKAFKILRDDKKVRSIFVNVFGGIVNCATIANGIVNAFKTMKLDIPLIVRLEGNNVKEAHNILTNSGLAIQTASDFDEAAIKAVKSVS